MKLLCAFAGVLLSASPLLASASAVASQRPKAKEQVLAPDGARGFGAELSQRDIDHLWSSRDDDDRAFLDGLNTLLIEVRVAVLGAQKAYSERGYFKLIPGSAGDDLALLHATYAKWLANPSRHLAADDARAEIFAEMLVDTRFNVRRPLLEQASLSLRELDRARRVLEATVRGGYTTLIDAERKNIATRADLAAAELRALRNDLHVLSPNPAELEDAAADLALRRGLLECAHLSDETVRERSLLELLGPPRDLERRMRSVLFSVRAEPDLRALVTWRERILGEGQVLRAQVLAMIPDIPEGQDPAPDAAKLGKSERMREAAKLACKGLLSDPLEPDLAWGAGHAFFFQYVTRFDNYWGAASYMDRFLALSGLRYSDANPGGGRQLTAREIEAYDVISRDRGHP